MGVLGVVLLVFFIVIAVLLILLVLAQSEEGDSLGGIFAGGSASAFGARSGNILTRATSVLGGLFLVISLALALVNRGPAGSGVEAAGRALAPETGSGWWREDAEAANESAASPGAESVPVETAPVAAPEPEAAIPEADADAGPSEAGAIDAGAAAE